MIRALALLLALAAPVAVWAQAPSISITGRVAQAQTVTVEALAEMPAFQVTASGEGGAQNIFVGAMLWPLIAAAGPIDGPERSSHLQHVIFARGADGYAVALAIGEIDPNFEAKPVIIAYKENGALLAAPRLVVPNDHRGGRSVRGLVAIDVR